MPTPTEPRVLTCIVERRTIAGRYPCGVPLVGREQQRGVCRQCFEGLEDDGNKLTQLGRVQVRAWGGDA